MINWEHYDIKIDKQAQMQLNHYFDDLAKILDNQNLSYKKNEVFQDLENHIIDYITTKHLQMITFSDSLKIINELGPPIEYADFSTIPSLVAEINSKKIVSSVQSHSHNEYRFLCPHCNAKNEQNSSFCVNCGQKVYQKISLQNIQKNSIRQLFLTNPVYFFSWLSLFILSVYFIVAQSRIVNLSLVIDIFFINELIIIPLFFIFQLLNKNSTRFELFAFFYSYIAKYFTFFILIVSIVGLVNTFGISYSLSDTICCFIAFILPFIFTWFFYFSNYLIKLQNAQNNKPDKNNLITYFLIEVTIFFSMIFLSFVIPSSPSLMIIIFLSTIVILLTYLIYDYYSTLNVSRAGNFINRS